MPTYTQAHRPIAITTPLGKDVLLLTGFRGRETVSQLFNFQVDLLAESKTAIQFDRIVGQEVTVELRLGNEEKRYFNGLVKRFSQGARDEVFVHFRAELVPKLWLLTKKIRSRIFQHLSVPEILRQVLAGLEVTYTLSETYYQRDYCVQYRESDFAFVSRLMEEEGIYYFFDHAKDGHRLLVTDLANEHPAVAGQTSVIYEEVVGGLRKEMRIISWEKHQELRSGEYTLRDHCFELPGKHLEAKKKTIDSLVVGEVTHKLSVGGNEELEIYDFPGGYAQRFDGVDRHGLARPQDLKEIFPESERTAKVRMEEEEGASVGIAGRGNCGNFVAGHHFKLERHFDANDRYFLTRVEHDARLDGHYGTGQAATFNYENTFSCIPVALPYRPERVTLKPVIAGIQTATVVGPQGEEIFCDKYGRAKVQFHWDREGKKDGDSSCWLRVAQVWAGKGWGAFFWPRIGHEVVVVFEEGDPDQPLIIGSVYNAENMPWFALPANKQLGGLKSATVRGIAQKNYNAIVFNDEKEHEHLAIHSERNMSFNSEFDKMVHAGRHKGERVSVANVLTVGNLPGGGGSGGSNYGHGFDKNDPMPEPAPTGILGLNSVMVYGENLQVAFGLNHQLAVGNNLQICINPAGLAAGIPGAPLAPVLTAALGSGMGGNMQLTMGTSASVVMGQAIDISYGPPKIEFHGWYHDAVATNILIGSLGLAAIVWVLVYEAHSDDHTRAILTIAFQALVDAFLVAIMSVEMIRKVGDQTIDDKLKPLFKAITLHPERTADEADWSGLLFGTALAVPAAILAPLLAIAGE